ncbi:chromatin-remodeling complex subunit ies6 [Steccherinum ochraceum]|uniref:Chromatin-remodeling complex subunit ies6 n=1 Tax=Steccherinum ochraceum TaxID=92696 RepID=A0A4R0RIG9_9APHY|nr:chromatin-remodeling complex subunit ies6 [Steccherinum ochraceum]
MNLVHTGVHHIATPHQRRGFRPEIPACVGGTKRCPPVLSHKNAITRPLPSPDVAKKHRVTHQINTLNIMPPRGAAKKKTAANGEDASTPPVPTLAEQLSYLASPRPFKNPSYTKNANRRTKNLKNVLTQERERERAEREKRRLEKEENMDVDGAASSLQDEEAPTYTSIEAPPSVLPQRHYCDITGLEAPYTDPATGLRYHDKSVYELIKGLSVTVAKDYLSARGVNPIVK